MIEDAVVEKIPFGKGNLILFSKFDNAEFDKYYAKAQDSEANYLIEYQIGEYKREISALTDIVLIADENKIRISEEIKGYEEKFSRLISIYENLGRLISAHPLYTFLESDYGFDFKNHSPVIKEDLLIFVTIPFSLENLEPPVNRIILNLEDMNYKKETLITLTEGSKKSVEGSKKSV